MYILGLSGFAHEASACLIKDGHIVSLIEEERLNREKHTWKYPKNAIEQCLAMGGITIKDVDHITFFWSPQEEINKNAAHFIRYFPQTINLFKPVSGGGLPFLKRINCKKNIGKEIQRHFNLTSAPKIHFIEHHLAHAASCFFVSPFEKAAILTMDGRGESTCTLMAHGEHNKITKLKEIKVPHSIGHLYAAITDYLGFKPFFDEWKVMGMSAYGTDRLYKEFEDVVYLDKDGYRLNLKYFKFHTHGQGQWLSDEFFKKFGPKQSSHQDQYTQDHFDMAYALQKLVEKIGVHLANRLYEMTHADYLCMTGGVMLNCLMNKKIIEQTPFKDCFIMPIANDAGTSLGSALYVYHQKLGQRRNYIFKNIYLGPEFNNQSIEQALKEKKVKYHRSDNVSRETAKHIADGKIVGWFQGRMEAGPRALGNRSIVADSRSTTMKDRLNARVKKREYFRPFAPSILEERVGDFFIMPKNQLSPHMILIGDVKEDKKCFIPAVTHADGTARVHSVNSSVNAKYWNLINEFEKITGIPVIINTSFNENEPIVCTPQEAINCFLRTEFDVLAIGDFIATK